MSKKERPANGVKLNVLIVTLSLVVCLLGVLLVWLILDRAANQKFYEGTTINAQDVSGLTVQQTEEKLAALAQQYQLTIQFEDSKRTLTAQQLGLTLNEDNNLKKLLRQQSKVEEANASYSDLELMDKALFSYQEEALPALYSGWEELTACQDREPADAMLVFDAEEGEFRIAPETVGGTVTKEALSAAIVQQMLSLSTDLNAMESGLYGQPIRTEAGEVMQKALSDANTKLHLKLTYKFEVPGKDISGKEVIDYDQLSQWLYVEEDGVSIGVDTDPVQLFAAQMTEKYSVHGGSSSQFVTTGGKFVQVDFPACDETVDEDALFNDVLKRIDQMNGGKCKAPYASTDLGVSGTTDLGGTYVEVDLDGQHLWVYKDHELVVDGPICSGNVAAGCATPGGLYTVKFKETDRWLNGPTWHDWVSYWMPFNGGIGLHDATWRSEEEFGGDVYLESGSHGCINMPLDLADVVYENVEVGGYVILYGGQSLEGHVQTLSGTASYYKYLDSPAFSLDIVNDTKGALTYQSSNKKVVTVDETGLVTVVGIGSATITVKAAAHDGYFSAEKLVHVTVSSKPSTTQPSATKDKSKDKTKDKNKDNKDKDKDKTPEKDKTPSKTPEKDKTPSKTPEKDKTPSKDNGSSGDKNNGSSSGGGSSSGDKDSGSSGGGSSSGDKDSGSSGGGSSSGDKDSGSSGGSSSGDKDSGSSGGGSSSGDKDSGSSGGSSGDKDNGGSGDKDSGSSGDKEPEADADKKE